MDELVAIIVEKTGISEDVARKVVHEVIEYLDEKLPSPIGGNLKMLLNNEQAIDTIENLARGFSSLFMKDDK